MIEKIDVIEKIGVIDLIEVIEVIKDTQEVAIKNTLKKLKKIKENHIKNNNKRRSNNNATIDCTIYVQKTFLFSFLYKLSYNKTLIQSL